MIEATSAAIAALNGTSSTRLEPIGRMLDQRQLEVRVGAGVAVPGKVLAAGRDALAPAASRMIAAPSRATSSARSASARSPITGFFGIGVDVEHRRVVERDADRLAARPPAPARTARRAVSSPLAAERQHRRPHGERRLQPRDASAFLVDADPERQLLGERLRLARQIGDLLGLVDVAREEDDAAEVELARKRPQLGRNRVAGEAGDRKLADVATDILQRHSNNYRCDRARSSR